MNRKMSCMELVEKMIFNGKTGLKETDTELAKYTEYLETKWFNTFTNADSKRKHKEESEEFIDAIISYELNKDNMLNSYRRICKTHCIEELSDFILSLSSGMVKNHISQEEATKIVIDFIRRIEEVKTEYGITTDVLDINLDDLHKAHINKSKEIYDAVLIYKDILYNLNSEESEKNSYWIQKLLGILTPSELKDPANKFMVVKIIRRAIYFSNGLI